MKEIIKKGDKFGRLTAVRFDHRRKNRKRYWLFKCDCGKEKIIRFCDVKNGNTKSCGCLNIETKCKHGMTNTRIFNIWIGMKQRCLNKNSINFKDYGGRGITVCNRWLIFENFYRDMGDCPLNKSLDRIKNDLGYCKENCRWATRENQANNRRDNILITYKRKTQTVSRWARELKIGRSTIDYRLKNGWSVERILILNLKK